MNVSNYLANQNSSTLAFPTHTAVNPTGYFGPNFKSSTLVPLEFSLEQGFILGIPLFLGLRKFKKKNMKKINTTN